MSEHGPGSTSVPGGAGTQPANQKDSSSSSEILTQAREQASKAGDYLARNVAQYPFEALLLSGLIGYGIGFLMHTSWSKRQPGRNTSAPQGHSGDALRPLE
jgi:hypothetical protein